MVPNICIKTFPNQKPWMNGDVRAKFKARTSAYNSGDTGRPDMIFCKGSL